MVAVYASTSYDWFRRLSELEVDRVAFWRPRPGEPKEIGIGEPWYFKQRGARLILGFGLYAGCESLTISELYRRYGTSSGFSSEPELRDAIRDAAQDNSYELATTIGNIILDCFTAFPDPVPIDAVGLADLPVPFLYLRDGDPIAPYIGGVRPGGAIEPFELRDPDRAKHVASLRKQRAGQDSFRQLLLGVYGSVCAVSGAQPKEVLQAAHIQPYVDAKSNHVANGLILRADFHALFDAGLLTFMPGKDGLEVHLSDRLRATLPSFGRVHRGPAKLANARGVAPSETALSWQRKTLFR